MTEAVDTKAIESTMDRRSREHRAMQRDHFRRKVIVAWARGGIAIRTEDAIARANDLITALEREKQKDLEGA